MNYSAVAHFIGKILLVAAALFLLPLAVSFIYGESGQAAFVIPMAILAASGVALTTLPASRKDMYIGEGFLTVTLSWLLISLFGAMPFLISGAIKSPVDAVFETISGFTTTGSTILKDIEALPYSLLFWRSFTHWIGGMGVLVFLLAITANKEIKTMYIMRAESPGPKAGKLVSKMSYTARILYLIYIGMTVLEIILLLAGGMPLFDAVVNSFSTAGTGGFGIKNASIAAYDNVYFEYVIGIFMLLFGVNFGLYFLILTGKVRDFFKNSELKCYLAVIAAATVLITLNILGVTKSVGEAVRYAFFTVSSTITTTGFVSVDYELWPTASKMIIFFLMFIGSCSSSTGGGIKVIRFIILAKLGLRELKLVGSPRTVRSISVDNKPVDPAVVSGVASYLIVYIFVMAISVLVLSFDNLTIAECISGAVTCLNNVGPGFESIGATGNFSQLSSLSKIVLSADMLLGRLELFPILALFTPSLWKV